MKPIVEDIPDFAWFNIKMDISNESAASATQQIYMEVRTGAPRLDRSIANEVTFEVRNPKESSIKR